MPHPREVESSCRRCSAHECPRLTRGEASHGLRASLGGRRPLIQQRSAELRHLRREAPVDSGGGGRLAKDDRGPLAEPRVILRAAQRREERRLETQHSSVTKARRRGGRPEGGRGRRRQRQEEGHLATRAGPQVAEELAQGGDHHPSLAGGGVLADAHGAAEAARERDLVLRGEESRGEEVLFAGGESVEEGVGVRPQGSVVRPSAQDGVRLVDGNRC
mmetsp:Transcript_29853/g.95508  ORF Transcript_29853/g.95508 Transcript_29853/m.95508 type:complete len:218 (+) Transcript_29853:276-929(+)